MEEVRKSQTLKRSSTIENTSKVDVCCVTLNCGGYIPGSLEELVPMFEVRDKESEDLGFQPDIYVIGL